MIRRMTDFRVETEQIDLPSGAFCKARRHYVRWRGRTVLGLSANAFRAYLFPVYTPAGLALTEEAPIDHPHHQSVWVGADHVDCLLPYGEGQIEVANYNFYVQETFQGRAAGRMIECAIDWDELAERHLRVVQEIEWRGPAEWGAPEGRIVAHESRAIDVQPGEMAHVIDVRSRLRPGACDLQIGPTRHAYFGIRLVEPLRPDGSAALVDAEGMVRKTVDKRLLTASELAAFRFAGEAIGVLRFDAERTEALRSVLRRFLAVESTWVQNWEHPLSEFLLEHDIQAFEESSDRWLEIDDEADFKKAVERFG